MGVCFVQESRQSKRASNESVASSQEQDETQKSVFILIDLPIHLRSGQDLSVNTGMQEPVPERCDRNVA